MIYAPGLPAKELMAVRMKGVPLKIAEASRVLAPLEPAEVATILNVFPAEIAAEMLWLYTLHPEDIAEVSGSYFCRILFVVSEVIN